jgi:ADP-dependent NAD(P)H-hydrate dehydratase
MTNSAELSSPLPQLPPRLPDSHKGDFGRLLFVGGSQGMVGAIALAGMAALRSGAGLVKLATPAACQPTVAGFEPCGMTIALPGDEHGRIAAGALPVIAEAAAEATVVACGPGLGRSDELVEVVCWLYQNLSQPLVVDADGLNALAQRPQVLEKPGGPRILTPHPGEFCRLTGRERLPLGDRQTAAREFAARIGVVVVLKGHRTVITDGKQLAMNTTGNPGMATAGTGDVLTGMITALLGQRLSLFDAARLGCHVHGLAGDLAAAEVGQVSLVASDLISFLPKAWRQVERGNA